MSSSLDYLELCRLCLVKDRVSVPIFEDEGDVRQIFLKITACLPVKVSREDKLPKKICDDCVYKVELFYQFWNTTANAEKQLLQWLGEVGGLEDKEGYVTEVLDTNVMKQERSSDSRLDGSVMQVGGHQNSMDMGMMDIITMPAGSEQQFTSVPMDTSGTVQTVQVVPGPSTQTTHDQMAQSQATHLGEESEEDNSEDGCDNEEGLPVKEEHEDDQGDQSLETTTFVALPCDEAGPSGLQQQKISEMSEMSMQQTADNDPKTGTKRTRGSVPRILQRKRPANNATSDSEQEVSAEIPIIRLATAISVKRTTPPQQSVLKSIYVKPFAHIKGVSLSPSPDTTEDSPKNSDPLTLKRRKVTREMHQCDSCDESFHDRSSLIIHKTEKSIVRTREALREPHYKVNCEMCNRQFISKSTLDRHYKNCGVVNTEDMPLSSSKAYRRRKPTKPAKKNKENEGTTEGPITCHKCGKVFKKEKYLKAHMTMAHGEHIMCHFCDVKLDSVALLKSHMTEEHSGEYTEFCSICNKGFFLRQSLKVHMTAHARDGKLNYCDICGKGFRHKVYLEKHVQHVHVEMQDRKKYKCDVCSYETQHKNVFKEHMYKHTGEDVVQCEVCNKRMRRSYMKIHLRIHSGYKPEVCEFCGKAFTARKYLSKHRVVHTGEKPYQCKVCDKRYTQRGTLTLHVRKKHQQVKNGDEVAEEEEEEEEVDQETLDQFVEVGEDGAVLELSKEKDVEESQLMDVEEGEVAENECDIMAQGGEEGELVDDDGKVVYVQKFTDKKDAIICEMGNDPGEDAAEVLVSGVEEIVEEDAEEADVDVLKSMKSEESEDEEDVIYEVPEDENDAQVVENEAETAKDDSTSDESLRLEMLSDSGVEHFEEVVE